jgi:hypothetical protein
LDLGVALFLGERAKLIDRLGNFGKVVHVWVAQALIEESFRSARTN